MPDLSGWPHADEILDAALDQPPAARPAFVREAAGGDAALASALDAVLAEADAVDEFLRPGGAIQGPLARDLGETGDGDAPPRLDAGARFGAYELVALVGQGGMGEVYRARDPRLARDVAIKVLPMRLAGDPRRHDRLVHEARLLAALNHPHIGAIYDVEEHAGVTALVLEFVEGPTLAERLARGRLAFDQAIALAGQIAAALNAAHARGIVHRDLKPANIKITPAGEAKVLDFGIATAIEAADADADRDRVNGASDTGVPATGETHAGAIFGTVSYLSPERARGERADHRADIWAFGCVLFEMLSGVKAFDATTTPEIVSRILERDPEFSRLPVRTPAALRRLLDRAFRKDPAHRLGFIGDAQLDLDDARIELRGADRHEPVPHAFRRRARRVAVTTLIVGAAIGGAAAWRLMRGDPPRPAHLAVPIADQDELVAGELPGLAISPDGRTLVYRTRRQGVLQLVRRSLDAPEATPLPGSVDGASPFFSPDGQWIGFTTDSRLMKVPLAGGPAVIIAQVAGGAIATWIGDTILFATNSQRVIQQVPAAGGTPVPVTRLDTTSGQQLHDHPAALPGGRYALVTVTYADGPRIGVADLSNGTVRPLMAGRQPRVLPDGRLIFVRGDAIWWARLDPATQSVLGEPAEVQPGVELSVLTGTAHYAVGEDGTLMYIPRRPALEVRTPVWIARDGREEALPVAAQAYTRATVSPDGARVALALSTPEYRDVYVFERARAALMRLTLDPAVDTAPVWTPDSRRVAFRSERDGGGIFLTAADGSGAVQRLTRSDGPTRPAHTPYSFTPDGRTLLFSELRSYSDQGIYAVTVGPDPHVSPVLDGPFAEARPALSPDGRWLAYQSDESGRYEIYLRPYPAVDRARIQISTGGGTSARWSRDGREIFFSDGTSLIAVAISVAGPASLVAGQAQRLFDASGFNERLGPLYDIGPDGRFLFLRPGAPDRTPPRRTDLRLVAHWTATLR